MTLYSQTPKVWVVLTADTAAEENIPGSSNILSPPFFRFARPDTRPRYILLPTPKIVHSTRISFLGCETESACCGRFLGSQEGHPKQLICLRKCSKMTIFDENLSQNLTFRSIFIRVWRRQKIDRRLVFCYLHVFLALTSQNKRLPQDVQIRFCFERQVVLRSVK